MSKDFDVVLNDLESAVMELILSGDHVVLAVLRAQVKQLIGIRRRFTGVGFFSHFQIAGSAPKVGNANFELSDVHGNIDGVAYGVGFILFIREGCIGFLEGFTYDEPWPASISKFEIRCEPVPRNLEKLNSYQ